MTYLGPMFTRPDDALSDDAQLAALREELLYTRGFQDGRASLDVEIRTHRKSWDEGPGRWGWMPTPRDRALWANLGGDE